jgi:hypothetical protein
MANAEQIDSLLDAIELVKTDRREEARVLLRELIQQDSDFEGAWLWMSVAVDSLDQSSVCLDNVLRVNPENMPAAGALYRLREAEILMEKRRERLQSIHRVLQVIFWAMILGLLFAMMITETERVRQLYPVLERGTRLLATGTP